MPMRINFLKPPGPRSRAAYERLARRRADKRFYKSDPWRRMRALVLAEEPLCGDCLGAGRYVPSVDVHHIRERREFPELALVRENLQALCKSCHVARRSTPDA